MGVISTFPAGGGAKLNLKAYASASDLPASEKEGAVAVITSTAIGDVYAAADAPTAPAAGDVWVWLGGSNRCEIDLGKNILLPPRAAYQYSGSAWTALDSYVYTASAWVQVTLYVYYYGSEILSAFSQTSGTFAKLSGSYQFGNAKYTNHHAASGALDLTDVSAVEIIYSMNASMYASYFKAGGASVTLTSGTYITKLLDVSGLSGLYTLSIEFNNADALVYNYVYSVRLIR